MPNHIPLPGEGTPEYKFNSITGWPDAVNEQVNDLIAKHQGKPFSFADHATERNLGEKAIPGRGQTNQKINIGEIPGLKGAFPGYDNGWNPVEVEHNGKDLTKLVMRGPYREGQDVTIPFVFENGYPFGKTAWGNDANDDHAKTLDLNRVHLPEEFKKGKPPRRRLLSAEEAKSPGYMPIPHTRAKSVARIVSQYGWPQEQAAPQQSQNLPQGKVANFVDFDKLKKLLKNK